jgi:hypothetical protein
VSEVARSRARTSKTRDCLITVRERLDIGRHVAF